MNVYLMNILWKYMAVKETCLVYYYERLFLTKAILFCARELILDIWQILFNLDDVFFLIDKKE